MHRPLPRPRRTPAATGDVRQDATDPTEAGLITVPCRSSSWEDRPLGSPGPVTKKRYPSVRSPEFVEFPRYLAPGTSRRWPFSCEHGYPSLPSPPYPATSPRRAQQISAEGPFGRPCHSKRAPPLLGCPSPIFWLTRTAIGGDGMDLEWREAQGLFSSRNFSPLGRVGPATQGSLYHNALLDLWLPPVHRRRHPQVG